MFFEQFKFSSVDLSWFQIDGSNQWYLSALHKFPNFIYKALFILEIFNFLYFCPSLFFLPSCFRRWSKTNPKVYDVINCLNKNSITNFVWYILFGMTLSMTLEHQAKNIFIKKSCWKCAAKASPRPLYNPGK